MMFLSPSSLGEALEIELGRVVDIEWFEGSGILFEKSCEDSKFEQEVEGVWREEKTSLNFKPLCPVEFLLISEKSCEVSVWLLFA